MEEGNEEKVADIVPDLHAAMWRNVDLEIDFDSVEMKEFEKEHAAFLKEYEEAVQKQVEGHEDQEADDWGNPRHADWVKYVQHKLEKRAEEKKSD